MGNRKTDSAFKTRNTFWTENEKLLKNPKRVAIISARHADKKAVDTAYEVAKRWAERVWVIVTGLARNVDWAAFQGALAVPNGAAIGILAERRKNF